MADLNDFYPTNDFHDVLDVWIRDLIGSTLRSEYKNVETLSADRDLEDVDAPIQVFDADGGDYNAVLPAPDAVENHPYLIRNAGGSGTITVKSHDEATTHAVLTAGEFMLLLPDGEGEYVALGLVAPGDFISSDADNALVEGTDGKLFIEDSGAYKSVQTLITHGQGTNVPAGSTRYMVPAMMQTQTTFYSIPMPAGTFRNLFVRQSGTQPAGGTLTFKLFAGPVGSLVDTGIGITFAAGSSGQDRTNSNTYVHTAGQHIQFVIQNNDPTNASSAIGGVTIEFVMSVEEQ